jgi:hypothetical protein
LITVQEAIDREALEPTVHIPKSSQDATTAIMNMNTETKYLEDGSVRVTRNLPALENIKRNLPALEKLKKDV